MTFDKEEHRQIINRMMDGAEFPGKAWREVHELRSAIERAKVKKRDKGDGVHPAE